MKVLIEKEPGFAINTEQAKFTLAENSALFDILCNKIYSNKVRAVIRELTCNAIDSHIEAGQTRRVEIKLPQRSGDEFYIQDFGTGLSKEQCLKLYVTYGMSTKTETNDAVGFMGIGSKSFWSVTNMATIVSVKDGLKHTLVCSKDKEGNQVINCMSGNGVPTSDPNGVKISFIVNSDSHRYREEALQTFKNFDPKHMPYDVINSKVFEAMPFEAQYQKDNLYKFKIETSYYSSTKIEAVMGGVTYPVDTSYIKDDILGKKYNVVLYFNIGDLSVNAGRESLKYTDETIANINDKLQQVFDDICKSLEKKLQAASSNLDKIIVVNQSGDMGHFMAKIKANKSSLDYAGILKEAEKIILEDIDVKCLNKSFYGTVNKYSIAKTNAYHGVNDLLSNALRALKTSDSPIEFVYKDGTNYFGKINHNIVNADYIFIFEDEAVLKKLSKFLGKKYLVLSDMDDPPKNSPQASSAKTSKIFKFDSNGNAKFSSTQHSTYWEEVDYDLDNGGFYVEINRYLLNGTDAPETLTNLINVYNALFNTKFNKDIFGVKTKFVKNIKKSKGKWINIVDFLRKECDDFLVKKDLITGHILYTKLGHILNKNRYYFDEPFCESLYKTLSLDNKNYFDKDHIISKFAEAYKDAITIGTTYKNNWGTTHNGNITNYIKKFHSDKADKYTPEYSVLEEVALQKYPLLSLIDKGEKEDFLNYIKMVDRLESLEKVTKNKNKNKVGV